MDPALLAINHFCRAVGTSPLLLLSSLLPTHTHTPPLTDQPTGAQIHCRTIYGNPHDFASDLVAIERRVCMYVCVCLCVVACLPCPPPHPCCPLFHLTRQSCMLLSLSLSNPSPLPPSPTDHPSLLS